MIIRLADDRDKPWNFQAQAQSDDQVMVIHSLPQRPSKSLVVLSTALVKNWIWHLGTSDFGWDIFGLECGLVNILHSPTLMNTIPWQKWWPQKSWCYENAAGKDVLRWHQKHPVGVLPWGGDLGGRALSLLRQGSGHRGQRLCPPLLGLWRCQAWGLSMDGQTALQRC